MLKFTNGETVEIGNSSSVVTIHDGNIYMANDGNRHPHKMDTKAKYTVLATDCVLPNIDGCSKEIRTGKNDTIIVNNENNKAYFIKNSQLKAATDTKRAEAKRKLEEIEKTARELKEEFNL